VALVVKTQDQKLADCLGGLVSTVMGDIRLTITVSNPHAVTVGKVMTRYPTTQNSDGTWTVTIKDMYSEEMRDVPVALVVKTQDQKLAGSSLSLLSVKLSYMSAFDQQLHTAVVPCAVALEAAKFTGPASVQVDEQRNRFMLAEAMEEARKEAEKRDFEAARQRLEEAQRVVNHSCSAQSAQTTMVMNDAMMCMQAMSPSAYTSGGSQQVSAAMARHQAQRCNEASDEACYLNAWKADKKAKSKKC